MTERVMNTVRSLGSILDIWPTPRKLEEVSSHDAAEMVRQSWEDVDEAFWGAIGTSVVDGEEEQTTEGAGNRLR